MPEEEPFVTVTTDIAAPPGTVWRVLTAFGRYPAWHPVLSLDGTAPVLAPGARLPFRLSGAQCRRPEAAGRTRVEGSRLTVTCSSWRRLWGRRRRAGTPAGSGRSGPARIAGEPRIRIVGPVRG
ncbi:MAG: SRPBCC family protein [Trebonia sp.]